MKNYQHPNKKIKGLELGSAPLLKQAASSLGAGVFLYDWLLSGIWIPSVRLTVEQRGDVICVDFCKTILRCCLVIP